MRLSMWTSFLYEWTPEGAISTLARHGYTCAELSDEHAQALLDRGNAVLEGRRFREFCESQAFDIPQGHFYLKVDIAEKDKAQWNKNLDDLKRWCDLFNAIGIKAGVIHPGRGYYEEGGNDRAAAMLEALLDYSRGMSFSFCLENLIVAHNTFPLVKELIDSIRDPEHRLAYCLDTGHLAWNGGDCADYIRQAGADLKALHITDCLSADAKRIDHIFPFSVGAIKWREVIAALREVNYQGIFNYEVPRERGVPAEILLLKLDYSLKLAQAMMNLQ